MSKKMMEVSVAAALIISVIFSIAGFNNECNKIRSEVLRLHILADSDSPEDQNIKLIVRDVLLNCGNAVFSGKTDLDTVRDTFERERQNLIDIIDNTLLYNGFNYKSDIFLAEEYFTTRTYGDYTLPAGKYLALKVILGEGEGHNWWCVMFPPLCLPAASSDEKELELYFDTSSEELIKSNPQYDIRFKIIEIFEKIKNKYT